MSYSISTLLTRGVVFTEDVVKIAGQQGRDALGHGLSSLLE